MAQGQVEISQLPNNLTQWHRQREMLWCEDMVIHNLKAAKSASEIELEQFLALKVIWSDQRQTRMKSYLAQIGFDEEILER